MASEGFQLSLLDESNLCEVTSPDFPGERLVVCRNPMVGARRARKRQALLDATEKDLEQIKSLCSNRRSSLYHADKAGITERVTRVINKHKMAKHFILDIADGAFSFTRNQASIDREAALDGIYILRTDQPQQKLSTRTVVRAYRNLKVNEQSFKQMKSALEVRPVHHRLSDRVRAHVFLCMLARYIQFELELRLAPLLFKDDTPQEQVNPVTQAARSPQAQKKAQTQQTEDGYVAHSLKDLLSSLATITKNTVKVGVTEHTFERITSPTPLQAQALKLAANKPSR